MTEAQKLDFYKKTLTNKEDAYVLCNMNGQKVPLYIRRSESAPSGFFELNCTLFSYTFTKGNASEEKFMKEQGYVIIDNLAYDIQTPLMFFDFDKYLGDMIEITKKECILLLKEADSTKNF